MSGDLIYICEACRRDLDINDPTVVKASELVRVDDLSGSEVLEGNGVLFHARCWTGNDRRYRRKPG